MDAINSRCLQCCIACCRDDATQIYNIQNKDLKTILQGNNLRLCFICKRFAQNVELFIESVQKNQKLLHNLSVESSIKIINFEERPLKNLQPVIMDTVEIGESVLEDGPFPVLVTCIGQHRAEKCQEDKDLSIDSSHGEIEIEEPLIKSEPVELKSDSSEVDRPDPIVETGALNSLKVFIPCGSLKKPEPTQVKRSLRALKTVKKEIQTIKNEESIIRIKISKKEIMDEREEMAKEEFYNKSTFKCKPCIKGFMFKNMYTNHMKLHHESSGKYECEICTQRFPTTAKFLVHWKYHEIRYRCTICYFTRKCRKSLRDHYEAAHSLKTEVYKCKDCDKQFQRRVSLKNHRYSMHNSRNMAPADCKFCNKPYKSHNSLRKHMLQMHYKEVANDKPRLQNTCPICGKYSNSPANLREHIVTHSQGKNFYCVECNKSFKTKSTLRHHLRRAAAHAQSQNFTLECHDCGQTFGTKDEIERHIVIEHLNIRPFPCDQCDKTYTQQRTLKKHKKIAHEGFVYPKIFICLVCGRAFNKAPVLAVHMRTHTGERPLNCLECPATFRQAGALQKHVRMIHRNLTADGRPKVPKKVKMEKDTA